MRRTTIKIQSVRYFWTTGGNEVVNFLLQQKQSTSPQNTSQPTDYSQRILQVSVWSEEDLQIFEETKKQFNSWQIQEW